MSSIGGSMPCSGASRTSVISFMRPTISRIRSAPSFARSAHRASSLPDASRLARMASPPVTIMRSEEHTSELQSLAYLVCRLLLEKKKKQATDPIGQTSDEPVRALHIVGTCQRPALESSPVVPHTAALPDPPVSTLPLAYLGLAAL